LVFIINNIISKNRLVASTIAQETVSRQDWYSCNTDKIQLKQQFFFRRILTSLYFYR